MNLYGAEEFAHSGDCPGCQECYVPYCRECSNDLTESEVAKQSDCETKICDVCREYNAREVRS